MSLPAGSNAPAPLEPGFAHGTWPPVCAKPILRSLSSWSLWSLDGCIDGGKDVNACLPKEQMFPRAAEQNQNLPWRRRAPGNSQSEQTVAHFRDCAIRASNRSQRSSGFKSISMDGLLH
jgi:hypothetical protein